MTPDDYRGIHRHTIPWRTATTPETLLARRWPVAIHGLDLAKTAVSIAASGGFDDVDVLENDPGTATLFLGDGHISAVGVRDRLDDREAEARAVLGGLAVLGPAARSGTSRVRSCAQH